MCPIPWCKRPFETKRPLVLRRRRIRFKRYIEKGPNTIYLWLQDSTGVKSHWEITIEYIYIYIDIYIYTGIYSTKAGIRNEYHLWVMILMTWLVECLHRKLYTVDNTFLFFIYLNIAMRLSLNAHVYLLQFFILVKEAFYGIKNVDFSDRMLKRELINAPLKFLNYRVWCSTFGYNQM